MRRMRRGNDVQLDRMVNGHHLPLSFCLSLSVSLPLSVSVFLSSRSHERRAREGQKDRHIEGWTESEERTSRNGEGDYRGGLYDAI